MAIQYNWGGTGTNARALGEKIKDPVFWYQVVSWSNGSFLALGDGNPEPIIDARAEIAPLNTGWSGITVSGAPAIVRVCSDPQQPFPSNGQPSIDGLSSINPPIIGNVALNGDTVVMEISGSISATARFQFVTTQATNYAVEYTVDGVNWIGSGAGAPLLKRVDVVSANPSLLPANQNAPFVINTGSTPGFIWEMALASNVLAVRCRVQSSPAQNTIIISAGIPYNGNTPVCAVLYDTTTGVNVALDTGILDVSGWADLLYFFVATLSSTLNIVAVDDTGTGIPTISNAATTAAGGWGVGVASTAAPSVPLPLAKRVRFSVPAVGASTSRVRIECRR